MFGRVREGTRGTIERKRVEMDGTALVLQVSGGSRLLSGDQFACLSPIRLLSVVIYYFPVTI